MAAELHAATKFVNVQRIFSARREGTKRAHAAHHHHQHSTAVYVSTPACRVRLRSVRNAWGVNYTRKYESPGWPRYHESLRVFRSLNSGGTRPPHSCPRNFALFFYFFQLLLDLSINWRRSRTRTQSLATDCCPLCLVQQ